MFKVIRKWYFKIYHLFKLLGIFILIFGIKENIYAEECTNLITKGQVWGKNSSGNFILNDDGTLNEDRYVTLEPETEYTIFFDYGEEEFKDIINFTTTIYSFEIWHRWGTGYELLFYIVPENKSFTFKTQSDGQNNNLQYYFRMRGRSGNTATTPFIDNKKHEFWLVKGTEVCRTKEEENSVYSSFLNIYVDRITYLAEGFTNNPYLIAMIGIIFSFIILEITLKLFNIRGGKK